MDAVEFTTALTKSGLLQIPTEAAARLPRVGRARVIILTDDQREDWDGRAGPYAQFLREDSPEDALYDSLR